jgi:hypothetical protein
MIRSSHPGMVAPKPLIGLFALVFLTYGYFYQSGQHNENARLGQTRAIVEQGQLNIPGWNTADVIRYEGKLYPNKAPGTSLLAIPSWWLFSTTVPWLGLPEVLQQNLICHLTIWTTVGLFSALLVVVLYLLLETMSGSPRLSLFLSLAFGLGTIAFPYATLFFSHQLAASLLFFSFALVFFFGRERSRPQEQQGPGGILASPLVLGVAGFCAGYALTTEYPTLIGVGPITIYAFLVTPRKHFLRLFLPGLILGVAVLGFYNLLAFGKLYMIPYSVYGDSGKFPEHQLGYMGVHLPDPRVLAKITFEPQRGLFYANPWLVLLLPALLVPFFSRKYRLETILCSVIVVAFLLFNAGYGESIVFWGGGASVGPRHVVPMLPFAVLLIAPLLGNRPLRFFFYASVLVSIAVMLMATATEPRVPYDYRDPVKRLFWDGYVSGRLSTHLYGPFGFGLVTRDSVSFNLGKLLGLPARLQFLPLFAFWLVMFARLLRRAAKETTQLRPQVRWPALVVAVVLLVLFSLPFLFGSPEVKAGAEGNGLRGTYVRGLVWDEPSEVYEPFSPEDVWMSRVDEIILFNWTRKELPIADSFSVEWVGFVYIPVGGRYKFALESDDGSSIHVDGRLLLDNWGRHARRRKHAGINLKKGFHHLAIRYYNEGAAGSMYLLWAPPGTHLQTLPKEHLFPSVPEDTGS